MTLSGSLGDTWHTRVGADCAELRDRGTESLARCPAQCRVCRQDLEPWGRICISRWSCRNFGSHQHQALCHHSKWSCNVLHTQKSPGKAGGYFCPTLGEEPSWSHSTEALSEAGDSPRGGEGAEPWLEPFRSWVLEWPEHPLTTARSSSGGSSAWSPALECLPCSEIRRRMCDLGAERRACNFCTCPGQVGRGLEHPAVLEISLPEAGVE